MKRRITACLLLLVFLISLEACAAADVEYTMMASGDAAELNACNNKGITEIVVKDEYKGCTVTNLANDIFDGCTSLKSVQLPDTLTYIGFSAFKNCKSLKSIVIPEGVTQISDSTFEGCTSLEEVTLPESLRIISEQAFKDCSSLKKLEIPGELERIYADSFEGCGFTLEELSLPKDISISDCDFGDFLCDIEKGEAALYFTGDENTTELTVPESVMGYPVSYLKICRNPNYDACESFNIPHSVVNIDEASLSENIVSARALLPDVFTWEEGPVFENAEDYTEADTLPDWGLILPAAYADGTKDPYVDFYMYSKLPAEKRSVCGSDAGAILLTVRRDIERDDYFLRAFNRTAEVYLINIKNGQKLKLYTKTTKPPFSGEGVLYGDEITDSEIWSQIEKMFE